MRITSTKSFVFLLFVATAFAGGGAIISNFTYSSQGSDVEIEWQTTQETNLDYFVVYRSPVSEDDYDYHSPQIYPNSSHSYSWTDKSAYKLNGFGFKYKLMIVTNDGQPPTYAGPISVFPNISGVQRTWGSIKAMFR
jgi:hypothetical protein